MVAVHREVAPVGAAGISETPVGRRAEATHLPRDGGAGLLFHRHTRLVNSSRPRSWRRAAMRLQLPPTRSAWRCRRSVPTTQLVLSPFIRGDSGSWCPSASAGRRGRACSVPVRRRRRQLDGVARLRRVATRDENSPRSPRPDTTAIHRLWSETTGEGTERALGGWLVGSGGHGDKTKLPAQRRGSSN